ncbi:uncharacterized protein PG998_007379 [Apiospora kogelbergensis]|uniref:uncharacterized protein n=1 Tax=Apiospora kogelbergensis TaxID=1337665 RepID=UPI00312FDDE3
MDLRPATCQVPDALGFGAEGTSDTSADSWQQPPPMSLTEALGAMLLAGGYGTTPVDSRTGAGEPDSTSSALIGPTANKDPNPLVQLLQAPPGPVYRSALVKFPGPPSSAPQAEQVQAAKRLVFDGWWWSRAWHVLPSTAR